MEKDNFLVKLNKLLEVAKSKHNALDVTEINDFFIGDNLGPDQMEQISWKKSILMWFPLLMTTFWQRTP